MAHTTFDKYAALDNGAPEEKWSPRKTLLFVIGASLALWGLIFLGVAALI